MKEVILHMPIEKRLKKKVKLLAKSKGFSLKGFIVNLLKREIEKNDT